MIVFCAVVVVVAFSVVVGFAVVNTVVAAPLIVAVVVYSHNDNKQRKQKVSNSTPRNDNIPEPVQQV
jgi:hypothetical protein